MLSVIDAKYLDEYRIWVKFNTGDEGEVDLESDLWGPVFEPLRNIALFKQFEVSPVFNTLVWNSSVDIAPEYLRSKPKNVCLSK